MSAREARFEPESRADYRSSAKVDRDRVQYSTAFARLAEVTQVVSAEHGYVFHNRLTHSLKVAQLAKRMAEKFLSGDLVPVHACGGLDADAAEAAGLAHDLGHPPFGHITEELLNELAENNGLDDGFEGNAQSFRIVTKLAVSDAIPDDEDDIRGLNFTRASLNAILKYPWFRGQNSAKPRKWGAYESERPYFEWARDDFGFSKHSKSLEAELMDWADDITYAVHDLIDFYCAGKIPLERLSVDGGQDAERTSFFEEVFGRCPELSPRRSDLQDTFTEVLRYFPLDRRYSGTFAERRGLWNFTTILISRYVEAIHLDPERSSGSLVMIDHYAKDEIRMLKELTWHYVILNSELASAQHGQTLVVADLFEILNRAAQHENQRKIFPASFREDLARRSAPPVRLVIDYIAGMTEKELCDIHATLTGRRRGSF